MTVKQTFTTLFILFQLVLNGQSRDEELLEPYLYRIEKLVDTYQSGKGQDLGVKKLLEERTNSSGEERVEASQDLFTHYIYKSTELAKRYNDEALRLSSDMGYHNGFLRASLNQAYILFVHGEFEKSLSLVLTVQSHDELTAYPEIETDCMVLKAYISTERGKYDWALENGLNLLESGNKTNDPYTLMRAYSAVSHVYLRLGEYRKALENCLMGLDYVIQLEKVRYILPKIDEIARMTHKLEGSKKALAIYEFYLDIEKKMNAPGDYITSVVYMNIADVYTEEEEFEKAERFLDRAMAIIDKNDYRFRKPRAHVLKAALYAKTNDITRTIDSYEKAFIAAEGIEAFDVIKNVSASLSELYGSTGDTVLASSYADRHNYLSDSLFSVESDQRIKFLEAKQKISEISREKEILELRSSSQQQRYHLLQVILMLALVSGGIATYSYYKVKTKNRLLYDRTKELTVEKLNQRKTLMEKVDAYSVSLGKNIHTAESLGQGTSIHPTFSSDDGSAPESYIDADIKEIILTKLERLEKEHFFLDPKCNLHSLSEALQTNKKYLSLVINNEKKSNFNTYLNKLRIDFLLNRLLEDRDFRNNKLSYMSKASGFNNQNTFYSAFKKRFGILPSYFIKQLNEEEKA